MSYFKSIKIIFIVLIATIFVGCSSDKLSRGKAEKLIREAHKFPYDEIEPFEIEYSHLGYDIGRSTMEGLQKEGLLTFTEISAMGFSVIGELTESGKQYAVSDKYSPSDGFGGKDNYRKHINVRVAKLDFGEITGILQSKESNSVIVNYTVIRKGITPFGRIISDLKEGVVNASASFTKYNNVWRIVGFEEKQQTSQGKIKQTDKPVNSEENQQKQPEVVNPADTNTLHESTSAKKQDFSQKDVWKIVDASKDHTTLVAALKQAGYVTVLSNAGPFTVFAPTNNAFNKLASGTVEDLMKDNKKADLQNILQYHIAVGVYKIENMQEGQKISMANSQDVTINVKDGKIVVNGTANIVASIPASNGIIHVIDAVPLPSTKN